MKNIPSIKVTIAFCASAFICQSILAETERPQHFEGQTIETWQQAQKTLTDANQRLRVLLNKPELSANSSVEIHQLSYSMENALLFMRQRISNAETVLELMHLSSESPNLKQTRKLAEDYLQQVESIK